MHIVLGSSGHVGGAVARALLARGERVIAVARDAAHVEGLRQRGATVAAVDVLETAALRDVLRRGRRLFLLNPPAAPSTDAAVEERRTLASILDALEDAPDLERVVALSAYGAQPGRRVGDLGVLYDMEQALAAREVPTTLLRAAYYFSNWDASLKSARDEGVVHTFYPTDFPLPMVAAADLGTVAAQRLAGPLTTGIHHVEGPVRYTADDVARAFADALGRDVRAAETPRERWRDALTAMGFSAASAESFETMTVATRDGVFPDDVVRGPTTLVDYVAALVRSA